MANDSIGSEGGSFSGCIRKRAGGDSHGEVMRRFIVVSAAIALALVAAAWAGSAPGGRYSARAQSQAAATTQAPKARATGNGAEHVVQRGETLGRIAATYGVSVQAIMAANGIENANLIYEGQVLVIPGAAGSAATAMVTGTPGAMVSATATGRPTMTRSPSPTATATLRPIQATRTAAARASSTRTPSPTRRPSSEDSDCRDVLVGWVDGLRPTGLASGATISIPPGWMAREAVGLGGALPYVSDGRMSSMIYLVSPGAGTVDERLDMVLLLTGASESTELLRSTSNGTGIAVWSVSTGRASRLVAAYVLPEHTGVFSGSATFCDSTAGYTEADAEAVAGLLEAVVSSYRRAE